MAVDLIDPPAATNQRLNPPAPRVPASNTSESAPRRPIDDAVATIPARLFLVFGWMRAAVEKAIDTSWWTGDAITEFINAQETSMLSFMAPLVETLVAPAPALTAGLVLVAQVGIAAALMTRRYAVAGLIVACALNTIFVLMGAVTPSAFYLMLQLTLLLAAAHRHRWFSLQRRTGVISAAVAAIVFLVPSISTLDPAEVIHDPALMLITVAALTALTQVLAIVDRLRFRPGSPLARIFATIRGW